MLEDVGERSGGNPWGRFFMSLTCDGDQHRHIYMDEKARPPVGIDGGHKKLFEDCIGLLTSVRGTLAELLLDVQTGGFGVIKDLVGKQSELEQALRRAMETEQKFNDWQAKQRGEHAPDEIDFDAVRRDIGCRLDRLRDCCGA